MRSRFLLGLVLFLGLIALLVWAAAKQFPRGKL